MGQLFIECVEEAGTFRARTYGELVNFNGLKLIGSMQQ